jgi:hypothetical protein
VAEYVFDPIGADGVLKVRWKTGVIITEELARALLADSHVLTKGKRIPHLADIRLLKSMSRDARKVFGDAGDSYTALALLASSPVARMIGNFFIGLNRTRTPTQMFSEEAKAIAWLRQYAA